MYCLLRPAEPPVCTKERIAYPKVGPRRCAIVATVRSRVGQPVVYFFTPMATRPISLAVR
jgi:hypothetical protein